MLKNKNTITGIMKETIVIIFTIIIAYLTVLSCFSTTAMTREEHSFLIADSVAFNLLAEMVFIIALLGGKQIYKRKGLKTKLDGIFNNDSFVRVWMLCLGIASVLFVLCMNKAPKADQYLVCKTAYEWSQGVYTSFAPGNYLDICPHQSGIVLFNYILGSIFGHFQYTVYQIINALALVQLIRCFVQIPNMGESSPVRSVGIVGFSLLFLPCVFYTTFVYGTMIGLSLAVTSFYNVLCFIEDEKLKHAAISVICIFLAVAIKQNFLIYGIAVILYIAIRLPEKKYGKSLMFLLLVMIAAIGVCNAAVRRMTYQITNHYPGEGMSNLSYVSMGISESNVLYDGWWDADYSTVNTYKEANYDKALQEKVCRERILQRIAEFRDDPGYALRFFAGKNASQWNNPDFQGWWVNVFMSNDGQSQLPLWLERLLSIPVYYRTVFRVLNVFHFIILCGVMMQLLATNKWNERFLLIMITFIGGFLFHTIWEAKGQYTITYFLPLLPVSVEGYGQCLHLIDGPRNGRGEKLSFYAVKMSAFVLLLLIVHICDVPLLNSLFIRDEDTDDFAHYVYSNSYAVIPDGEYRIHPVLNTETALASKNDPEDLSGSVSLTILDSREDSSRLTIRMGSTKARVFFLKAQKFLGVPEDIDEKVEIRACEPGITQDQQWILRYQKNSDVYYILANQYLAMSYDDDANRIYLSEFVESEQQQWRLEKLN